ncbi:MAG: redoxin domain-containing protein [Prevotella sp.]|nr:redoxin domain-containing protein [Prevotella sp.]
MKVSKLLLGLAAAVLTTTACQSNNYKIEGVAEGFEDGDTIVLYEASTREALDTIIVNGGKFSYEGEADSVVLQSLMALDGSAYALFFNEAGTIQVTLSKDDVSRISGTKANDAWQAMTDKEAEIEGKAEDLLAQLQDDETDENQRAEVMEQYNKLQEDMSDYLRKLTEDNIDNEFGYFVLTQMGMSDLFDEAKVQELIDKLPENFKQRQAVADLQKALEDAKSTAVGQIMPDFILSTTKEIEASVLEEVKKNKITVLDFWASWCGPCREEMPFMQGLLEKYQEQGFGIVGISLDDDRESWDFTIFTLGLGWPQFWDNQKQAANAFHIQAIPFTVVVDQNGKILAKELRGEELEQFVKEQLQ